MADLTFAVGDIHACADLLDELLDRVRAHADGRSFELIAIGDYIDKGPHNARTLVRLMSLTASRPSERVICLKGNHEADLIAALDGDERALAKWLAMGGDKMLDEFGVRHPDLLPAPVLDWIKSLPTFYTDGLRYFVHAGLHPDRPLALQTDEIRLSMRGAFLTRDHDFGPHVVHGHTPQTSGRPELRKFRTNLDTSAFSTGVLTAAYFSDRRRGPTKILQTGRSERDSITDVK